MIWSVCFAASLLASGYTAAGSRDVAENIDFLGFSKNDTAAAWRIGIEHARPDGSIDRFHLIHIVSTRDNKVIASIRDGSIQRLDAHGHRHAVTAARLADDNPEWAHAAPYTLWPKLKHEGRFRFVQLKFKNNVVRLLPDTDSKNLSLKVSSKTLHVDGKPGAPLGFVPVARLFEGEMLPLGHFRSEGSHDPATPPHADLKVFHSRDGMCIAVLNRFRDPEDPHQVHTQAVVVRTPHEPIGSTDMGMLEMVEAQSVSADEEFKSMHPNLAKDYDTYVGKWF